jgi:hypothetical protein
LRTFVNVNMNVCRLKSTRFSAYDGKNYLMMQEPLADAVQAPHFSFKHIHTHTVAFIPHVHTWVRGRDRDLFGLLAH